MKELTLGSLFDGSGTCPLAARTVGIRPVWASEIEDYPRRVTQKNFPDMLHLGDITKINGAEIPPVDIITGGSPCQDLSVAGKRKGLIEGERSNLFFEMKRVITEMREATNGQYPRFVLWENVPGAFSSNKGDDFLEVLQQFAEVADPFAYVPEPKRKAGKLEWKYSGFVDGGDWTIAWRTFDLQFWGCPQRRRRIYLCLDLGRIPTGGHGDISERYIRGRCAGKVLFEREGLRRDIAQSKREGQGTSGSSEDSTGDADKGVSYTLNTIDQHAVCYGICSFDSNSMKSKNPHAGIYIADTSRTLDLNGGNPACNQGGYA